MNVKNTVFIFLFILLWFINPILSSLLILILSIIYQNKPVIVIFGLLLSIYFSFISYSIDTVGDFLNYKENIALVVKNGLDYSVRGGEFGYYLIVLIFSYVFNNSIEITHIAMLIMANVILFLSIANIDFRSSIFIFLLLQFFSVLVINPYLSRQFLSIALVFYSLSIGRGKYAIWIISIFIHFSSLIYVTILLFSRGVLKSKRFYFIIISLSFLLFVSMNLDILKFILTQNILPEFIKVKADFYLRMQSSEQKIDFVAVVFCVYTFFIKYKMLRIKCSKIEEDIINLFFISAVLCFSFIQLPVLPTRLGYLTYYLSPFLLILSWRNKKINILNFVNVLFLIFCVFITIYKVYLNDFSEPWVLLSDGEVLTHYFLYYINRI
ncbi:hypothetical protein A6E12_09305 [Aliivibrio fischeri]|uniref:EpsG family protein n=1 Tax=Aliivibrio fischeri TaxID=668 RepID=UPI00080DB191|nr:EpsG family protein [Aliivibrio fischeri]OCH28677.1 hypothetical protein A6E12_09305 [Aliivibrio fischeri]